MQIWTWDWVENYINLEIRSYGLVTGLEVYERIFLGHKFLKNKEILVWLNKHIKVWAIKLKIEHPSLSLKVCLTRIYDWSCKHVKLKIFCKIKYIKEDWKDNSVGFNKLSENSKLCWVVKCIHHLLLSIINS